MVNELDVLRIVGERLDGVEVPFMLTGSFALAYYAAPRMTRDLDFVVELQEGDVSRLVATFSADFYVDGQAASAAVRSAGLFNLMHLDSGIKVDLIVRRQAEYRQVEFARRRQVTLAGVVTWIATCEDLILSKLVWARDTGSELQRRDVLALLAGSPDAEYLDCWAGTLGVAALLQELRR